MTHSSLILRIGRARPSMWLGVLCLVAGLASAGPARGQSDTGSLRVLVLDQTGTNYADPNTSFGTAQFGSITSAGLPRIVQLAVRVGF